MQENYENFKIFTAFSRDQDDKCYVQHVIRVRIPIKFNYSKVGRFFQFFLAFSKCINFKIDGSFPQLNQHVTSFFVIDLRILYVKLSHFCLIEDIMLSSHQKSKYEFRVSALKS